MSIKEKISGAVDSVVHNPTLSLKEQLGYSGGIFGNTMGQDSVHTYGDIFARDFMGISSQDLQKICNISAVFNFINPAIAGALFDKNRKNGKMTFVRMALGISPLPFAISSMLLFVVPSSGALFNFLWNLLSGRIFSLADCFFDTAMNTLALRMVPEAKDRKNFFTLISLASTLGSMLPGWIIPFFVDKARQMGDYHAEQWAYFKPALVFCILGLISMYMTFIFVKDRPVVALSIREEDREKVHWNWQTLSAILHNRPFIVNEFALLFDSIRQITYSMLPYFYKDTFGDYKLKPIIDAVSGTLSYAGLFAVPFVGTKVSARNMMMGGYGYTGLFYVAMSLLNIGFGKKDSVTVQDIENLRKKRWLVGFLVGFAGMPNAAMGAARRIIVADSTDYMEWYSEKKYGTPMRSDGILSGAQTLINNAIGLLKANIYNYLFSAIGYQSINSKDNPTIEVNENGTYQSNETLRGIFRVVTLCGLIGNICASLCFLFDNYSGKRKQEINEELAAMRAARTGISEENAAGIVE